MKKKNKKKIRQSLFVVLYFVSVIIISILVTFFQRYINEKTKSKDNEINKKSVYLFTIDEFNKISSDIIGAEIQSDNNEWSWTVSEEHNLDDNEKLEEIGNAKGWDIDNIYVDVKNDTIIITIK